MTLAQNLIVAQNAINYIAALNITSSNKGSHRLRAAGGVEAAIGTDLGERNANYGAAGAGVDAVRGAVAVNARAMANNAEALGAGNCGELAYIALREMYDDAARPAGTPLHTMYTTAPGYDHQWAVIGLDPGWQPDKVRSWGAQCVWVDPWQHDNGVCFSINDFVAGKVRNLNALYKMDSVERVNAAEVEADRLA